MMYVLVICAGISAMGCGVYERSEPMTQTDCYGALEALRFDVDASGDTRRSAYALCKPVNPSPAPKGEGE
ncbi:hypothetical protein HGG72_08100 [Ochrobactrum pecoris]|nr:hypothetical protein [Brucella pecoris]